MAAIILIFMLVLASLVGWVLISRNRSVQRVLAMHESEQEKLAAARLKFQVLDNKMVSYTNSLDDRHHKMIQEITELLRRTNEVLASIDTETVKNFPVETECMFNILNNKNNPNETKIFDTESDDYKIYDSLRGWEEQVDRNIKMVGKVVLTASRNFKKLQPERHQRNDTIVDFQRAGILDIKED